MHSPTSRHSWDPRVLPRRLLHILRVLVLMGTLSVMSFGPILATDLSRTDLVNRFSKDLTQLYKLNNQSEFGSYAKEKALAICVAWHSLIYSDGRLRTTPAIFDVDTPIRWYQFATQKSTLAEARQVALEKCKEHEGKSTCSCQIFAENDAIVYEPPLGELERLRDEKTRSEQYSIIIDNIDARFASHPEHGAPGDVLPGLGVDRIIRPIGCDHSYTCQCHRNFRNDVVENPVAGNYLRQIQTANLNTFFDCREYSTLGGSPIFPYKRRVCHYLAQDTKRQKPIGMLGPALAQLEYDEAIYEIAAPVDERLELVGPPMPGRRLVYARVGQTHYLGVEKFMPTNHMCAVVFPFRGAIFDVSSCKDTQRCAATAANAIRVTMSSHFTAAPLAAERVPDGELIPGEISFQRRRKPSDVLKGPFWENNRYNLNYWHPPSEHAVGFPRQEDYRGVSGNGPVIYSRLEASIMVSVGNNKYADPEEAQTTRYDEVVRSAFRRALSDACNSLKGSLTGDICKMGDQQ